MKNIKFIAITIILATLISCRGSSSKQTADKKGFSAIEKDIKSKFGDNAYYTNVTIIYNKSIGNSIVVTATEDPASLKMGEWTHSQGNWQQTSEVTIEIPDGTKASDFMFQLGNKISLAKLGELIETSVKKLKAEKDIPNPTLSMAFVKFPKNGDVSKTEYYVKLEPENGGTSFNFFYNLDGDLLKMDY